MAVEDTIKLSIPASPLDGIYTGYIIILFFFLIFMAYMGTKYACCG